MDGQYPPPMPPVNPYYPTYPNAPPPMYPPEPFPPRLHHLQTVSMESLGGGYSDYDDPSRAMLPPGQIQPRARRRQAAGSEHVKHRRTRSGCYTCRQRRVKCDETHPMCERCRKGKRECAYPGETPTSSVSKNSLSSDKSKGSHESTSSTSEDESEDDAKPSLAAIPDDDEDAVEDAPQSAVSEPGRMSGVASAGVLPNTAPVAERPSGVPRGVRPQSSRTAWKHSAKPNISQNARWASLPREVKPYLRYHRDCMSYHHYGFKYDAGDFLKTTYLEIAVNDDSAALLYGIVAFAAYHHALTHQTDIISRFLAYYNQSIMLLQQALKKKRHNVATLLTILQLATIEVRSLMFMEDIVPSMAGTETNLGREWFAACAEFYTLQARERPHDLGATFEKFFSTSRLLATDSTLLFAAKKKNTLSDEQFATEVDNISGQIMRFKHLVETVFDEPANFVTVSPLAPAPAPSAEDDITDFRDANFLYGGDYFTMNYVLIDFWAIDMMFQNRLATTTPSPQVAAQLVEIALKECKMFEA
ncbi:hypothetical protein LTR12_011018, partial [Friedmanniomyces endolithicus]